MSAALAAGRRVLPRGYADFARQVLIWFGFIFAYQVARGFADRNPSKAFLDGWRILDFEQRVTNHVFELTLQQFAVSSEVLSKLVAWTYWNSEFTVVGLALLWVYLRRHEAFWKFRNAIIGANLVGLIGYIVLPTAPPRMFPSIGFINHHTNGVVQLAANPYAAMPSLHAADALIVGWFLVKSSRTIWAKALWALWPVWVWFCVIATANHYVLDVLAGIFVAVAALLATTWAPRLFVRLRAAGPAIANLL
jgi:membrane-associated phospholipid phosphatase